MSNEIRGFPLGLSKGGIKGGVDLEEFKMHSVSHHVFKMEYKKPFGSNGEISESWFWDAYSTRVNDKWWIKLEYHRHGNKVAIPWFDIEVDDLESFIAERCMDEMQHILDQ